MFDRTRVKYYEKFLGKECVREFVGFEAFCAPKRAPQYLVDSTLEWVLTLPPELRIEGIRIARALLERQQKRVEAINVLWARNISEKKLAEATKRLERFDGPKSERGELVRCKRDAKGEFTTLSSRAEDVKAALMEVDSSIQTFTAFYGTPFKWL